MEKNIIILYHVTFVHVYYRTVYEPGNVQNQVDNSRLQDVGCEEEVVGGCYPAFLVNNTITDQKKSLLCTLSNQSGRNPIQASRCSIINDPDCSRPLTHTHSSSQRVTETPNSRENCAHQRFLFAKSHHLASGESRLRRRSRKNSVGKIKSWRWESKQRRRGWRWGWGGV